MRWAFFVPNPAGPSELRRGVYLSTMCNEQTKTGTYVTQGIVNLELDLKDENIEQLFVVINPSAEYAVTHMGERYTVLVPKPDPALKSGPASKKVLEAMVCRSSAPCRICVGNDAFVWQVLRGAALKQSKVELELVKANDQELKLVGVKAPAPTEAGASPHR